MIRLSYDQDEDWSIAAWPDPDEAGRVCFQMLHRTTEIMPSDVVSLAPEAVVALVSYLTAHQNRIAMQAFQGPQDDLGGYVGDKDE